MNDDFSYKIEKADPGLLAGFLVMHLLPKHKDSSSQSRGNSHATIFYSKAGTDVPSAGEVLIYENDIVYA